MCPRFIFILILLLFLLYIEPYIVCEVLQKVVIISMFQQNCLSCKYPN
jgi:hypothetical protein